MIAEAIVGIFARFGHEVPQDRDGFQRRVEDLTSMYLRLIGIEP